MSSRVVDDAKLSASIREAARVAALADPDGESLSRTLAAIASSAAPQRRAAE